MRRVLLLLVLLLPSMASAQSFIRYYPPSSGGGGGGTGTGITGCTTPGYNFADDTNAGLCLEAANDVRVQAAPAGASSSYFRAFSTGAQMIFTDASSNGTQVAVADNAINFEADATDVLSLTSTLGTGFLVAQGSTAAVAREFTSGDGTVVIVNEDGVSGNPDFTIDTSVVPRYQTGTADASGSCSPGLYFLRTDTNEVWHCTSTNTWTKVRTGTVAVANGGTGLTSGTSGGVLAFTAAGTIASSGALTANLPVIGGGAGVAPTVGTRSGNTTAYVTTTGTQTSGDCVKIDANGNHVANGSACGGSSSPSTSVTVACEFTGLSQSGTTATSQGDCGFGSNAASGGINDIASASATVSANHPGVKAIDLGTSNNTESYAWAGYWNVGGGGETVYRAWVRSPAALSDGTNTYTLTMGFVDTVTFASIANGCYVWYSHGINSGKFQYVCENATTQTTVDSGVTFAVDTWYNVVITVNSAGTSVNFTINGAASQDITTNIPASTTELYALIHGDRDVGTSEIAGGFADYLGVTQVVSR